MADLSAAVVVYFTSDPLTKDQTDQAMALIEMYDGDGTPVEVIDLHELASRSLVTDEDVNEVWSELDKLIHNFYWVELFGVIPTPLRERLAAEEPPNITVWEAWNIPQEGGPPQFEFKRWCLTYTGDG